MKTPQEIISDDEVIRVHAYANFGSMTPREVVNDGVRKYAIGYKCGATQVAILRVHGLITATKSSGYEADLTQKGKKYARAITPYDLPDPAAIREAALQDRIEQLEAKLIIAVAYIRRHIPDSIYEQRQQARAVLAKLEVKDE